MNRILSSVCRRLVSDLRRKIGTVCSGLPMKAEDVSKTLYSAHNKQKNF